LWQWGLDIVEDLCAHSRRSASFLSFEIHPAALQRLSANFVGRFLTCPSGATRHRNKAGKDRPRVRHDFTDFRFGFGIRVENRDVPYPRPMQTARTHTAANDSTALLIAAVFGHRWWPALVRPQFLAHGIGAHDGCPPCFST